MNVIIYIYIHIQTLYIIQHMHVHLQQHLLVGKNKSILVNLLLVKNRKINEKYLQKYERSNKIEKLKYITTRYIMI